MVARTHIKQIDMLIEVILRMIAKEREAQRVYIENAKKAPSNMSRILFEHLADEEIEHEKKLRTALELLEKEKRELSELPS